MAKTRAASVRDVFNSSGYKGVMRRGRGYGWSFTTRNGQSISDSGYPTAEVAALAYDDFASRATGGNAQTNQSLGYLKPRDIPKLREQLDAMNIKAGMRHQTKLGACGFKGVSKNASVKKPFKSQIVLDGVYTHIGTFETAEEAARAYDDFVLSKLGPSADTNVSRGLLPPLQEPVFDPRKKFYNPVNKVSQEINKPVDVNKVNSPMYGHEFLTPEQERKKQIEAARLMAEADDTENDEGEKLVTPQASPTVLKSADKSPSSPSPKLTPQLQIDEGHVNDILKTALDAMRKVADSREQEFKSKCAAAVAELNVKFQEYQQTVETLIDRAAALELAFSKMKDLLGE